MLLVILWQVCFKNIWNLKVMHSELNFHWQDCLVLEEERRL